MELVTAIASACGSFITILSFIGVMYGKVKPVIEQAEKLNGVPDQLIEINDAIKKLNEVAIDSREAHLDTIRDRLAQSGKHYIHQGWITLDDLDVFNKLYARYVKLGGNGSIKTLHNHVNELEIR